MEKSPLFLYNTKLLNGFYLHCLFFDKIDIF